MTIRKPVGRQLRALRLDQKLSTREVASRMRSAGQPASHEWVRQVEDGLLDPRLSRVSAAASALGATVQVIPGGRR